jgi:biopolymer transport protein ExbD
MLPKGSLASLAMVVAGCTQPSAPAAGQSATQQSATQPSSSSTVSPAPAKPEPTIALRVQLDATGVTLSFTGGSTGAGCAVERAPRIAHDETGATRLAAVKSCAADIRAALGGDVAGEEVLYTVASEAPYQKVVELMDAVRAGADAQGVAFGPPVGLPGVETAHAVHTRGTVPMAGIDEGMLVLISRTKLLVGDDPAPVLEFAAPLQDPRAIPGSARAPSDPLLITPLATRSRAWLDSAKQTRAAGAAAPPGVLIADAATPYRLIFEVLHTLEQSGFAGFELIARSGETR